MTNNNDAVYLVKLTPMRHFRLALEFADGVRGIFMVLDNDFLGDRLPFLRSEEYFALASIKDGDVFWPGGETLHAVMLRDEARFTPQKRVRRDGTRNRRNLRGRR